MEFVKTVGPLGMIFIMFSLGLNLSYKDFFEVLKKPRDSIRNMSRLLSRFTEFLSQSGYLDKKVENSVLDKKIRKK